MTNPISQSLGIFGVGSTPALGAQIASGRATPVEMAMLRVALQAEAVPDAQLLRAVRQFEKATTPAQQTRAARQINRLLLHASRELVLAQVRFRLGADHWEPRTVPLEESLADLLIVPPPRSGEQIGLQPMAATVGEGAQCRGDGTYFYAIQSTGGTGSARDSAELRVQQLNREGLTSLGQGMVVQFNRLREANPSWVPDFRGADLSGANLAMADLSNANLTDAKLRRANLNGAYLIGTILDGADLALADISNAIGLTAEQLSHAASLLGVTVANEERERLVNHAIDIQTRHLKASIRVKQP